MAQIGCLGDVVFEVSSEQLLTINNMQWSGSSKYATHQRHRINSLTEFVGISPDKVSFSMLLSTYLGVDPQKEIGKLWAYERTGTAVPLVIGDKAYGKYRWSVLSHRVKITGWDGNGNVTMATVTVELQEYLRS